MELRALVLVEAGSQPWSCVLLCLLRQVLNRGAACYRACCCWCSTVGLRAPVLVEAGSQPWSCVLLCLLLFVEAGSQLLHTS